jgi:hypothetical protein
MAIAELIPLHEMTDPELRLLSAEVFERVSDETVQTYLGSLMLHGVVRRHTDSPTTSYNSLRRIQQGMRSESPSPVSAYAIRTAMVDGEPHVDGYVGMASLQPDLPLRAQQLPIPPPYARQLGKLPVVGPALFSREVLTEGPNAVAWVDPRVPDAAAMTETAQFELRQQPEAYGRLWRIIPENVAYSGPQPLATVMHNAGYDPSPDGHSHYFDDLEVGKDRPLPASVLYSASAIDTAA